MTQTRLTLVHNLEGVEEFLHWLGERHAVIAFDTETEGLNFWQHKVRLIQVGDTEQGWAFPWEQWGGLALNALQRYEGTLVAHNAKFDVTMIEEHCPGYKVPWHRVADTSVMVHLVDSTWSTALKPSCERYLGFYATAPQRRLEEAMKAQGWDWATVPLEFPGYWAYGAADTVLTARLYTILSPRVYRTYAGVYDLEMATQRIVMNMERRGARIDIAYVERMCDELADKIVRAHDWCALTHGVNPASNQQVAKRLVEQGVRLSKKTATGQWSLDKEVLEKLAEHNDLARVVFETRKMQKILSTYFESFIMSRDGDRLHPNIRAYQARTGRMSVTEPPLQTLPRGALVRDAFIGSPGNVIVSCDSDQIEMRLLAHFCKDPALIAAINSGDLHTETARLVYNDPNLQKKDPRRQTAKNAGFAKIYGAGVDKFAQTAGISTQEAASFLASYDATFPGVRAFQQQVARTAQERVDEDGMTWVQSPIGRTHRTHLSEAYKLVNYLIQGTAADVLKTQLINLDMSGFGDWMILPVHDEVLFDIPQDEVEAALPEIERAMTMKDWEVPITVSAEGPFERWGQKYR